MAMRKDFFVSYTKADKEWAEWVAWALEQAGYTTMIQAWDFGTGTNFVLGMHRAVKECKQTILVLSKEYLRSVFAASEWAAAFVSDPKGERRKLLPVRVSECQPDGLLADLVYTDLFGLTEADAREKLLKALKPRLKPSHRPIFPGTRIADKKGTASPVSFPGCPTPATSPDAPQADRTPHAETLFRSVAQQPTAEVPDAHYSEVTRLLLAGKLIPFLGLGIHFEVGDHLWGANWSPQSDFFPAPREYGAYLAQYLDEEERIESGMEIARIYQFLDETRGRVFVQNTVHRLYDRQYPRKSAHAFFASWNHMTRREGHGRTLPIIATTNLDDVLEQAFSDTGEPFSVVSYISQGPDKGRLLFRSESGEVEVIKTVAQAKRVAATEPTLIVKLHGGVDREDPGRETMVLTEDDQLSYFESPAVRELLPELLINRIGNPRFLFLGYSLRDWNIRFLLEQMWRRARQELSWAALYNARRITRTVWLRRGVEVLDVALEQYLAGIARRLPD